MPFPNALSVRKRSVTKGVCTGHLAHVPMQVRLFLLAELKRDTPRDFDMKRLVRNAFSERPKFKWKLLQVPLRGGSKLWPMTHDCPWFFGSVPTTPDPNTFAKVSRYRWEPYRDTNWWCIYYSLPRGGHTFAKVSQ